MSTVYELRQRMSAHLASQSVAVLSTRGELGLWSMPVRYRSRDLDIECLVPRWADILYHMEQCEQVILVIQSEIAVPDCWVQYLGTARRMWLEAEPTLFDRFLKRQPMHGLYEVFRISPQRIDLVDETRGWGMRENLDLR
jgi:hypothetical protein